MKEVCYQLTLQDDIYLPTATRRKFLPKYGAVTKSTYTSRIWSEIHKSPDTVHARGTASVAHANIKTSHDFILAGSLQVLSTYLSSACKCWLKISLFISISPPHAPPFPLKVAAYEEEGKGRGRCSVWPGSQVGQSKYWFRTQKSMEPSFSTFPFWI